METPARQRSKTHEPSTEFLKENIPVVMDWPSNSPDLNPIENLWGIVKNDVERRMPKNLGELESFMVEEWNRIPESMLINLVGSMKRRCELIIEKNKFGRDKIKISGFCCYALYMHLVLLCI